MTSAHCTLSIRVVPGAKNLTVESLTDSEWKIRLRARAVEGQANQALLAQPADWLGVPRTHVHLQRGQNSRLKIIAISGLDLAEASRRLDLVVRGA